MRWSSHDLAWLVDRGQKSIQQPTQWLPFLYRTRTIHGSYRKQPLHFNLTRQQHTDNVSTSRKDRNKDNFASHSAGLHPSSSTDATVIGLDNLEKLLETGPRKSPRRYPDHRFSDKAKLTLPNRTLSDLKDIVDKTKTPKALHRFNRNPLIDKHNLEQSLKHEQVESSSTKFLNDNNLSTKNPASSGSGTPSRVETASEPPASISVPQIAESESIIDPPNSDLVSSNNVTPSWTPSKVFRFVDSGPDDANATTPRRRYRQRKASPYTAYLRGHNIVDFDDIPKAHLSPMQTMVDGKRLVSHSGEHYVDRYRRTARSWTKPADLSEEMYEGNAPDASEPELGDSGSSLQLTRQSDEHDVEGVGEYAHARESTITDFERKAFSSLFQDLVKKSDTTPVSKPSRVADDTKQDLQKQDKKEVKPAKETLYISQGRFNLELNALLRASLGLPSSPNPEAADVSGFPAALQDLAADALATISKNEAQADAVLEETRFIKDPVVKKRMDELQRVTARMLNAKNDADLWQILDQELFSKFRTLDLDGVFSTDPAAALEAPSKRRSRASRELAELEKPAESEEDSSIMKPDLTILAPNYPLHLLTALRLLTRRAKSPSQLAMQIIPTLKSLGPSSHILGASTALYNEVLRYQWKNLASLQGFLSTLREMEDDGITMDAGTFAIIDGVSTARWEALRGLHGAAARDLEEQEWRMRAGVEIHKWKTRWLQMQEEEARADSQARDMRAVALSQWQITEHPGARGNPDIPPGPAAGRREKTPLEEFEEGFSRPLEVDRRARPWRYDDPESRPPREHISWAHQSSPLGADARLGR